MSEKQSLADIVDLDRHPLGDPDYVQHCADQLNAAGVLVLDGFMDHDAISAIRDEAIAKQDQAYFCAQTHSVYLTPEDPTFDADHAANRQVMSSKGCICDDVIDAHSSLRGLYDDPGFRSFVGQVVGQDALHPYADPLSSINIHYAKHGQESQHFDNHLAITLLIKNPGRK